VAIDMPVEIFGQASSGKVFREETRTLVVNAHGALLLMTSYPEVKPSILLVNKRTRMEAQCRVIFQQETEKGKGEMSVEFVDPQPRFWGHCFSSGRLEQRRSKEAEFDHAIVLPAARCNGRKKDSAG
jgi:hypothetical protein